MIVQLTPQWQLRAVETGVARQNWAIQRAAKSYGREQLNPLRDHIYGCLSECSVAKALGVPWDRTIGRLDIPDVGGWVDVRARRVPGLGNDLVIYPKDPDERPFVHTYVHDDDWRVEIVGWLFAKEAKAQGVHYAPSNIFYVPPPYRDIAELIELARSA